jgi:hypothetical protein
MRTVGFYAICIAIGLQVLATGCGKEKKPSSKSEKRPAYHTPQDASRVIGKSKEELILLWGRPSSWSSQGDKGSETEQLVYHFLKPGGKSVLSEHMHAGNTPDGKLTVTFSPFAPEVLENYWVWRVSIEKGSVTDARCFNDEEDPTASSDRGEFRPVAVRATPAARNYVGFSSLACFHGGCLAVVCDAQGEKGLLRWDRSSKDACTFLRLQGQITDISWKLCVGLHPYDYYPILHVSDDGKFGVLTPGFPPYEYDQVCLLNVATGSCREILKGCGLNGVAFVRGTHTFTACLDKTKLTKQESTERHAVIAYDCDTRQIEEIYAFGTDSSVTHLPLRFQQAFDGRERYGILEFMPPDEWTFGFVNLRENASPLAVLGAKGIGDLSTYGARYFTQDGKMVATDEMVLTLTGDTLYQRLWNVPSATIVAVLQGLQGPYRCTGWSPDYKYVAYTGLRGKMSVHMQSVGKIDEIEPKNPDYLSAEEALMVLKNDGKPVAIYTPEPRCIVAFVGWCDRTVTGFYDPSKRRFCLLDLETQDVTDLPTEVGFHAR